MTDEQHSPLMTRPALLPCPFCGGPAATVSVSVVCPNADCFGPVTTAANLPDSVEQWNKRAAPDLVAVADYHDQQATLWDSREDGRSMSDWHAKRAEAIRSIANGDSQ